MTRLYSIIVLYNPFVIFQIQQLLFLIAKNMPLMSRKYDITYPYLMPPLLHLIII